MPVYFHCMFKVGFKLLLEKTLLPQYRCKDDSKIQKGVNKINTLKSHQQKLNLTPDKELFALCFLKWVGYL